MTSLVSLLIYSLAILITAYIIPGIAVGSFLSAIILAIVLALLNAFVKPILILLTLPINILTLGLFSLVINLIILYLAAAIVPGFRIDNLLSALFFGILLAIINSFLLNLVK